MPEITPTPRPPLTILGIVRDPDGTYTIIDSLSRQHIAGDELGLGKLVARLVADPDLPRSTNDAERNPVVEVVGQLARKIVTDPRQAKVVDLVEPLAHLVGNELARARQQRPAGRRRRASSARR